jgi:hypothetical protein
VGVVSALAYTAIYIRGFTSRADYVVNMSFSLFVIPIYLAIVTNICTAWGKSNLSANRGLLFALSVFSILIAIDIIHKRYSGHLWEMFTATGYDAAWIALVVISLAIAIYFGAYSLIRLIFNAMK